jgi:hypothetical protein
MKPNETIRYEVPELSDRFGVFVLAETLSDAQRIARENLCDAVWEVKMAFGIMPLLCGSIHVFRDGKWQLAQKGQRCTCGTCELSR